VSGLDLRHGHPDDLNVGMCRDLKRLILPRGFPASLTARVALGLKSLRVGDFPSGRMSARLHEVRCLVARFRGRTTSTATVFTARVFGEVCAVCERSGSRVRGSVQPDDRRCATWKPMPGEPASFLPAKRARARVGERDGVPGLGKGFCPHCRMGGMGGDGRSIILCVLLLDEAIRKRDRAHEDRWSCGVSRLPLAGGKKSREAHWQIPGRMIDGKALGMARRRPPGTVLAVGGPANGEVDGAHG
jgi:hypothetical protein